jgi:hypothetical protein
LSSSQTGALRIRAIVFDLDLKTVENDSEKDGKTNQPDPLGRDIASEQAD